MIHPSTSNIDLSCWYDYDEYDHDDDLQQGEALHALFISLDKNYDGCITKKELKMAWIEIRKKCRWKLWISRTDFSRKPPDQPTKVKRKNNVIFKCFLSWVIIYPAYCFHSYNIETTVIANRLQSNHPILVKFCPKKEEQILVLILKVIKFNVSGLVLRQILDKIDWLDWLLLTPSLLVYTI